MNSIKLKIDFDIAKKEFPFLWPSFFNMGSCFAENQSLKFNDFGFSINSNPFGIFYNPISIELILRRILTEKFYTPNDFLSLDGYFSLEHHGSYRYDTLNNAIEESNLILTKTKNHLKRVEVCVITLGSSLVYKHENKIVANCHRLPTQDFEQVQLTHQQVLNSIASITDCFKSLNKNIHIVFTVSPVRHLRSGVIENSRSKAILISALHDFIESKESINTSYFPAYEIFMDELRDYRFSKEDFVHPTKQAQDYIWGRFCDTYFTGETKTIISSVEKYLNYKNHRPSKIELYQKQLNDMKQQLLKTYPFLKL